MNHTPRQTLEYDYHCVLWVYYELDLFKNHSLGIAAKTRSG